MQLTTTPKENMSSGSLKFRETSREKRKSWSESKKAKVWKAVLMSASDLSVQSHAA